MISMTGNLSQRNNPINNHGGANELNRDYNSRQKIPFPFIYRNFLDTEKHSSMFIFYNHIHLRFWGNIYQLSFKYLMV